MLPYRLPYPERDCCWSAEAGREWQRVDPNWHFHHKEPKPLACVRHTRRKVCQRRKSARNLNNYKSHRRQRACCRPCARSDWQCHRKSCPCRDWIDHKLHRFPETACWPSGRRFSPMRPSFRHRAAYRLRPCSQVSRCRRSHHCHTEPRSHPFQSRRA
ncbi:hypothetical protein FQZ97_817050 [compost metagenome]